MCYSVSDAGNPNAISSLDVLPLSAPTVNSVTYGERAFPFSAPILWNNLPDPIKNTPSLSSFKSALKTFLFRKFIFDLFHVELYLAFRSPNFLNYFIIFFLMLL